jgi:hypothetical protein
VTTRRLFQCSACRLQTSLTAGTIFASTHLPLRLWFRAMYHLTQSKQGISGVVQNQPFSGYTGARKQPVHESRFWFESCPLPEARDSPGQAR